MIARAFAVVLKFELILMPAAGVAVALRSAADTGRSKPGLPTKCQCVLRHPIIGMTSTFQNSGPWSMSWGGDVLQLGAITLALGNVGGKRKRQLRAELPLVPDAVRVLRHKPQRSRVGDVGVRLQGVLVVTSELVGEHNLIGSRND
jgi:hypothetical protein